MWRARALDRDEHVAVKLLREDPMAEPMAEPKAVNRFVQERAILLMLRHPHIARVRDLVTVCASIGLVMDLVEGGSLRDRLHERGTLPPAEAATLLAQVAEALSPRSPAPTSRAQSRSAPGSAPTGTPGISATPCWPSPPWRPNRSGWSATCRASPACRPT
ncbi:protein kinase [Dactylosporangium sp. NPDC048998]|uniref:protein kinase domain-containing protein n=1 Tax=Dactylosporangium sp. NPDC048998 TaxID=3363976 RepID=UPI0037155123